LDQFAHNLSTNEDSIDFALNQLNSERRISFQAINPEKNVARFYTLLLRQNLFGEFTVTAINGRIGSKGRIRNTYFLSPSHAEKHLRSIIKKRLSSEKRIGVGYKMVA
jgi:predicted DNA-binding WGR domain protein